MDEALPALSEKPCAAVQQRARDGSSWPTDRGGETTAVQFSHLTCCQGRKTEQQKHTNGDKRLKKQAQS